MSKFYSRRDVFELLLLAMVKLVTTKIITLSLLEKKIICMNINVGLLHIIFTLFVSLPFFIMFVYKKKSHF